MTTAEAAPATAPSAPASADDGGPDPDRRPHRRLEVLGAALVVAVPILVALAHAARQPWVPTADNALIELRSWDLPGHIPLVGVYSRFGFHHPGPILFFVNSLPVHLLGPKGVLLATGVTNALALVGAVVLLDRRGGRPLLLGGTVVLLLLERAVAAQLLDPWNPWVTTMPFALLLLAVWSVWCRDWMALPVAALAGTYVLQAHLGFGPLVAVLGALAIGVTAWAVWQDGRAGGRSPNRTRGRADPGPTDESPGSGGSGAADGVVPQGGAAAPTAPTRPRRWPAVALGVTVLLLAVLWALPLVDVATQQPTNVGLIRQSLQNPDQPPAGPGQATDVAVHAIGASVPWITGQEEVEPFSNRVLGADWWTLLPVLAAVVAGAVLAARARVRPAARDALRFQAVVVLAAVVGWGSVVRITGNAYPYLVRWMWVIGAFAWLSAAWSAFTGWPRPLRRVSPPLPVAAAAVLVVGLVASVAAYQAPLPATADAVATLAVVNPAMGELQGAGTIVVRHEGTDLAEIPQGVYAELVRRGLPVYVTTADSFVTGEHHFLGDRRADATLVVATADAVDVHQWTGEKPIASYDRLTPEERTEYFRLAARAAAAYGQATRNESITDPLDPTDAARVRDLAERSTRVALFLTRNP